MSSFRARTEHSPAAVYARWVDPAGWPEWDPEVRAVSFEGPLTVGAQGRLTPVTGPVARFVVTEARPDEVFTDESRLPGARLVFGHRIDAGGEGSSDGCEIAVTIGVAGPLARVWRRILGPGFADSARGNVLGLLEHLDRADPAAEEAH